MKRLLYSFVLLISVLDIYSQVKEYNLPPSNFYKSSKIGLLEFQKFEAIDLSIKSDSIYFKNKYNLSDEKFAIDEINYLRVQEGTHAGDWAIYGGLGMGLACLLATIEVLVSPDYELADNTAIIAVGFIAGGTVLGALIGSAAPKWKTYYVHKNTVSLESVKMNLYSDYKSTGVQLKFLID
jgi:hypothetical protein